MNDPSVSSAAYTTVERQIVSSFTANAILLGIIFRALSLVLGLAEAKNTALGPIGSAIRQFGWSSGIPHGCGARGKVSSGRSPISIAGRGHRRIHHVMRSTAASFSGSVLRSIAMLRGKLRCNIGMPCSMIAETLRSASGGPLALASTSANAFFVSLGPMSRSASGVRTANDTRRRAQSSRCAGVRLRTPLCNIACKAAAAGVSTTGVKNLVSGKSRCGA
jgi:hypothetical protein